MGGSKGRGGAARPVLVARPPAVGGARRTRWISLAIGAWLVASRVAAQDVSAVAVPEAPSAEAEDHVERWLVHYARPAEGFRIGWGIAAIAIGAGVIPLEGWVLSTADPRPSSGFQGVIVEGAVGIGLAVVDIALGIVNVVVPSVQEHRLERWRALRARGAVSSRDIGRFEGEMLAGLVGAQEARWTSLALGIAFACDGVASALLTAAYAPADVQLYGYLIAGYFGVMGIVLAVVPWLVTSVDEERRRIESGEPPDDAPSLSFAPWASPGGGGLVLGGSF